MKNWSCATGCMGLKGLEEKSSEMTGQHPLVGYICQDKKDVVVLLHTPYMTGYVQYKHFNKTDTTILEYRHPFYIKRNKCNVIKMSKNCMH